MSLLPSAELATEHQFVLGALVICQVTPKFVEVYIQPWFM
jgi:hypothetical protein